MLQIIDMLRGFASQTLALVKDQKIRQNSLEKVQQNTTR